MPPRTPRGINFNTILIVIAILGGLIPIGKVIYPLAVVPDRVEAIDQSVRRVSNEVQSQGKDVTVLAESVKRIADIAQETNSTRRDVDKQGAELQEVKRRLDRLETR
jgi:hypothetical protein